MLYYASRISDHIRKREPEGYLFCVDVPIARSGTQEYARDEIGQDGDELVKLYRPEEEVFSKATMASFDGMPVTNDHPDGPDGVNVDNVNFLAKGHCQNVRRGTGKDRDLLIADLVITDQATIDDILNGKREISCGYTYELCEEDGKFYQRQIRGNHIAIVDKGRAGPRVCIKDSAPNNERRKSKMPKTKKNYVGVLSRMLAALTATDAEPEILEEAIDAIEDITGGEPAPEVPVNPEEEAKDEDPIAQIMARLDKLEAALAAKGTDEDPAAEEDPLKKLEDDLDELESETEEEEEVVPDEDPDEQEAHFVDPEEINEEDEDLPEEEFVEEEEEEVADCKARDAMRETIKTMRPIIAKLPKAEQKKASDALAAQLRKSYGLAPKATRNDYVRLRKAIRKKTGDSAQADHSALGRSIMESRNPNYKK